VAVKRRMRGVPAVFAALVAVVALAACGSSSKSSGSSSAGSGSSGSGGSSTSSSSGGSSGKTKVPSSFTIGATLPLTGPGAAYGDYMRDGLMMAANQINASGGIDGAKVTVDALDDQAQAGLAVSDTRQLLSKHPVAIASAYSAPPLAQRPIAAQQGVPVFNGGSFDPVFLNLPYLWNDLLMSNQTDTQEFKYAKEKLGVKKPAILFETDASSYALKVMPQIVQQVFGTKPAVATVDQTATNVTSEIQKLLATKPDMLYLYMDGNIASLTFKELAQLNVKIPIFGDESTWQVPEALTSPSLQIYGPLEVVNSTPSFLKVYDADPTYKKVQPPNVYVSRYYSIGMTVAQALKTAISKGEPATGVGVNDVLKSGATVTGAGGPLTYNAAGGIGGNMEVIHIENGKPAVAAKYPALPTSAYLK
jgi:branched-chain amino acid transport system substrate-binding protein